MQLRPVRKVWTWIFGGWNIKSNLYRRFLNWENFVQNVLTLASDRAVLYEDVAFSILELLIKKYISSFLKKVFIFIENMFKS